MSSRKLKQNNYNYLLDFGKSGLVKLPIFELALLEVSVPLTPPPAPGFPLFAPEFF